MTCIVCNSFLTEFENELNQDPADGMTSFRIIMPADF